MTLKKNNSKYSLPNFHWKFFVVLIFIVGSCKNSNDTEKSIMMYCAAGLKPAVEKVAKEYFKEYGVRVDLQYGGSGTLLSNLRVAKQGDLYLAGDRSYINEGIAFGLIKETQSLAYMNPVIAVKKGNPKGIIKIEDLFDNDIKVAIGNPDAASIGRLTKKVLTKSNHWQAIEKNIAVFMPTVNEVANCIKLGTVDAGIIWNATANQYNEIDIVPIPLFEKHVKNITIGVLSFSEQPTEALKFLRYLSAKDKGLPVFAELGYNPIQGDSWQEKPGLLFYSGGVNRLAIDKTIQEFEEREGVDVTRVYNGC